MEISAEAFLNSLECADLIHLTTPNSPTGEVIERDTIEEIIARSI